MPESIFIQVGQCGNQVGYRFWDLALQEYKNHKSSAEDMKSFFKSTEYKNQKGLDGLKARAVLVDMEEGVISEILRGPLKNMFNRNQLITDVSGSGNNWAVGNKYYGSKYRRQLVDLFRKEAEECDNLQCFFLLHSLGGGTGSGLGTAVLEYVFDEFPKTPRFTFSTFPCSQDDVITSPYNTLLSNNQLINFADCVIPFDNAALIDICSKSENQTGGSKSNRSRPGTPVRTIERKQTKPFDEMNNLIANTILNMTCSSRFPGCLNVDINDIVMNMTPFPRLHYLVPSLAPISTVNGSSSIDGMFTEAFGVQNRLFRCPNGALLASAVLCRGNVSMSDVQFNIERLKCSTKFVPWNPDGWKIGLCNISNLDYPHSVLMLSNTSSIWKSMVKIRDNFFKMYRKKAHLHHFLSVENVEKSMFDEALNNIDLLIQEYRDCDLSLKNCVASQERARLKILV